MKPFPLPVRAIGPGSQVEDETLNYLAMPQGMTTYAPPRLPETLAPGELDAARAALVAILAALKRFANGSVAPGASLLVDLIDLPAADRALVNQVLGEGEVAARIDGTPRTQVQESVFAGVWRVVVFAEDTGVLSDFVEVGTMPAAVVASAAQGRAPAVPHALPDGVMNAPALIEEIAEKVRRFGPGSPAHVVNLTLLPLSAEDRAMVETQLGEGRVSILSRGYGNCRIASTAAPNCWRVTYYNSQDAVILDTIEVSGVPEAACAAIEDLVDAHDRLGEVLDWLEAR